MGLNRQPFSRTLREMCSHVGLDVTSEEVWLLVRSRNSLVHCGRFYCETATPEDGRRCPPMGRAWGEYCFLIDFFERFFLRLLGHEGSYIDWQGNAKRVIHPPGDDRTAGEPTAVSDDRKEYE